MLKTRTFIGIAILLISAGAVHAEEVPGAPFPYVQATAVHVLPATHNNESGYFSLCEGLDGRIYIGTAKYGENSYLVEYDPDDGEQRVVIDTHKVCGLTATGYAAQAKIHTRNFVGPSGKVYVGSKQGYRQAGDTSEYPGGYVMTYDPRTGAAQNLGMPFPGQGVIDVVADEERDLVYVVTCEDQHWVLLDLTTGVYRELGPMLVPYATTLVGSDGRASVITKDFKLAQYDPATSAVTLRDIVIGDVVLTKPEATGHAIPCWALAADGRTAYMNMINFPDLLEIDLASTAAAAPAINHGPMHTGPAPDSRGSLCIGPDGMVYALVRVNNDTGFGTGYLHHLARFDPATKTMSDLGVLAVHNPEFFDFSPGKNGKPPPFSHGYHTLPDGTLTPLHAHMALIATHDGSLYATVIYPFTLLRIDAFRPAERPAASEASGVARQYLSFVRDSCDRVEGDMSNIVQVAEAAAARHLAGGMIGFVHNYQGLDGELHGRSGGLVHIGFERAYKADRAEAEKKHDMAIVGWQRAPFASEMRQLKQLKDRGVHILAFGPADMPELAEYREVANTWFDTGLGADDRVVTLADGSRAGRGNLLVNALYGWVFVAEFVSALTREGKMPPMWKAYSYEDGPAWGNRYLGKKQFHDDCRVPPIPAGELAGTYLDRIRYHVGAFEKTQSANVSDAVDRIARESGAGRKTVVASMGHMAWTYVGRYEDAAWCVNADLHSNIQRQVDKYAAETPDEALVLRLGYSGMDSGERDVFLKKRQRVMLISAETDRGGEFSSFLKATLLDEPDDLLGYIDMGYAFGDACVTVEGYPIRILPPSGIMQIAAYESVNVGVLSRLAMLAGDSGTGR